MHFERIQPYLSSAQTIQMLILQINTEASPLKIKLRVSQRKKTHIPFMMEPSPAR